MKTKRKKERNLIRKFRVLMELFRMELFRSVQEAYLSCNLELNTLDDPFHEKIVELKLPRRLSEIRQVVNPRKKHLANAKKGT